MTAKQAAERIGISLSLVYDLCRFGVLKHTRHGRPGKRGTIRITEEAIAEYLDACQPKVPAARLTLRHITS
jgi:excisionase family DNA binding protein